ncbi:MAG: AAA family ATPase [Intestinibacter sp.]|uniref:AAA family ATPase n=1 Tax=Intestinibacter sp. TaxID=1965304 RepID=UPI003F18862B
MRPIRLEISGLNSYIEKQVIDFEELTSRGLFGIFGKTGSGKSTILDAITIAMYGNISRDTNEYINTACNRAVIRYVFEIGNKHNKKRYEVERILNRNKSGAANSYSATLVQIHDDGNKTVIAEKKTQVDKAIVDIVGLTSSDFTRSVVLPQGKFSEFLQLDDSKRREMLERIFNLEKYGKSLTEKVKKRRDAKIVEIQVLENSLLQYEGTTQEVFDETYKALTELQATSRNKKRELDDTEKKYNEYKEIIGYQQSLEEKENRKAKLDQKTDEIEANKVKIERSGHAKIVNPHIKNVQDFEKSISEYSLNLGNLDYEFTASNREYESTKVRYEQAQKEKDSKLEGLIASKQKFERAIMIENQIKEVVSEIESLKAKVYDFDREKNSLNREIIELEEQNSKISSLIKENENKISLLKTSEDFKEKIYKAFEVEREYLRVKKDFEENKQNIPVLSKELDDLKSKFGYMQNSTKDAKLKLKNTNEKYEILVSKCPGTNDEIVLKSNKALTLKSLYDKTLQNESKLNQLQEKLNKDKEEKYKVDREIKSLKESIEKYKNEKSSLEKDLNEQKFLNLANELKSGLQDGSPCPVCGSLHHPDSHVVNNNEKIKYIEFQIIKVEEKIDIENKKYDDAIRVQSQLTSTISMTEDSISEVKSEIGDLKSIDLNKDLNILSKQVISLREKIEDWTKSKESLEKEIKELEEIKNKKEKEEIELNKDIVNKGDNLKALKENVEKINKNYDSLKQQYLYMISNLKIENLKEKVEEINKNSRAIEEIEQKNTVLKDKKEKLELNLKEKRDLFTQIDKNISNLNKENESNLKDKSQKEAEFNSITKGQNPKYLLDNIIHEINRITSTEAKLRVQVEDEKYKNEKLKSKISEVRGKLEESQIKYKSSKATLNELLFEYKFESIYAVKNSLIDEKERERLKDEIEFFEKEEKAISLEIQHLKQKLNGRTVDLNEFLSLEKNKYRLSDEIDIITKEIGAKQNEVMTLDKNLKKVNELQKQLDESTHNLGLLKEIEKLLQGKRFVEFVAKNQLEYIVIEASKRLDQMTKGRYVLEIDDNLNFVMRDNYNGGLRRGIKTLSGGETFLTSLALALALSSQIQLKGSAPLEFFFLDEGFGSLDNELLDVVMESLEKLHNEKLSVGIISHVDELKNRVPVKLIVSPNDGGSGSKINIEYS